MIQIALVAGVMALGQARPAAKPAAPDLNAPQAEDPQPKKTELKLVTDGKQHYFAFGLGPNGGIPDPVYWSGDGKQFFKLRIFGGGAEGDKSFDVVMWEPRIRGNTGFDFREGKYTTTCGERKVEFMVVPADQAKGVLEGATFFKPRWTRMPYALSRDEKGTYYFVDHLRDDENRADRKRDFRLFVGPRGSMKEQKMTNLVSDSEGDIFGTKTGDFRLVLNAQSGGKDSKWVAGGKETKLTSVPINDNAQVIYNDLGVYERQKLGTPCDEF
jgi:hypothetical protein